MTLQARQRLAGTGHGGLAITAKLNWCTNGLSSTPVSATGRSGSGPVGLPDGAEQAVTAKMSGERMGTPDRSPQWNFMDAVGQSIGESDRRMGESTQDFDQIAGRKRVAGG